MFAAVWTSVVAGSYRSLPATLRELIPLGYEVDTSMVLYNQPGPWVTGTEEKLVARVHEIVAETGGTPVKK